MPSTNQTPRAAPSRAALALPVLRAKYDAVAPLLEAAYGRRTWLRTMPALDTLVQCILSQNTTDANSGRAFDQLKARYPTYQHVLDAPLDELIATIRSAGLANQKAPRIQNALAHLLAERGAFDLEFLADHPADEARAWLTALDGVGMKTASIVVCFGFNGAAFPVDTHVNRVCGRLGFVRPGTPADKTHHHMEALVPPDDYYHFHLALILHGRRVCKARRPLCGQCPVRAHCDAFARGEVPA